MLDVQCRLVADVQRARCACQAQIAGAGGGIGLDGVRHLLADHELFADDGLAGSFGCMNIEYEICALKPQFIVKINCELDADHLFPQSDVDQRSGMSGSARASNKTALCDGEMMTSACQNSFIGGAAEGRHLRGQNDEF